jgi:phospholipid/cholesterol/gamma-HCH transport system substrate-binding protein
MTTTLTRIQLIVFAIVTVASVTYGSVRFFDLSEVIHPPYKVSAQFPSSGGIYPRADVDLIGVRVGSVSEVRPGPGPGTTVVMDIDHDAKIPRDIHAAIVNKSAIGEQFVALTPKSAGGAVLKDGDVISLAQTTKPIDFTTLLNDLDALAGSVPLNDLTIVMKEVSDGFQGLGPTFGRLIDDTDLVTHTSLEHVDELTALIDDASTVLDTQVDLDSETTTYLDELAPLTAELREMDGSFGSLFTNGIRAGSDVSSLLADIQGTLPSLLFNLIGVTDVAADHIPGLRKTLTMFPWILEAAAIGVRPCGEYNPETGKPIEATCNYDKQGNPIYSAYLGAQVPESAGKPPYLPCTKGYEATKRYLPNGVALNGGPKQVRDAPNNMDARCTAKPNDPNTPNVRGSQNAHDYSRDTR